MKVDNLLGPYLYQFKKLSLPGIGLFTLDDKAILPDDTAKIKTPIEGISFNAKTGAKLDDSLIEYIKAETGKMKALAEADLYSFIATAFQFLNIGKPFYFEGIGTLQKTKDGAYNFTAGTVIPQKTEEAPARYSDTSRRSTYNNNNDINSSSFSSGKLMLILGSVITLALIGWGGYYLYNKNTGGNDTAVQNETRTIPVTDTTTAQPIADSSGRRPDSMSLKADSIAAMAPAKKDSAAVAPGGGFKFVFETTDKKTRAVKRYEQLKGIPVLKDYNNKVAIETKDSVVFKIFTIVPCTAADTAHIKELLNAWYYGKKEMKVKIEQ